MQEFIQKLPQISTENSAAVIFTIIAIALVVAGFILTFSWYRNFSSWNTHLEILCLQGEETTDEDVSEFEASSSKSVFLRNLLTIVRRYAKGSKELSSQEIHSIIDEKILYPEDRLIFIANLSILTGLVFTVYGIFLALNYLTFSGSNFSSDLSELMGGLLDRFVIAFYSTIAGVVLSVFARFGQLVIRHAREPFQNSFVIYAKNILVPRVGIPDTERDLGKLVRSITKSSTSISKASDALIDLSQKTQLGTEKIIESVEGFITVTDTMKEREDIQSSVLQRISSNLNNMKSALRDITTPIEHLRQDLLDREQKIGPELEMLKLNYNEQVDLNKRVSLSLSKVEKSVQLLGNFFSNDFQQVLDRSMEKLTKDQINRINKIQNSLDALKKSLEDQSEINDISQKITEIDKRIRDLKDDLKKSFNDQNSTIEYLKTASKKINSKLEVQGKDIGENILSIEKIVSDRNRVYERIQKDINILKKKLDELIQGEMSVNATAINTLKDDVSKIVKQLSNYNSLDNDLKYIKSKIDKLKSDGEGLFSNLFRKKD